MPTKNPRVSVTFEEDAVDLLASIAKKENKSVSGLAKELILDALDRREDLALSSIAKIRDKKGLKKVEHEDAWK
ncbi:TPA: hypothetical protein DIC20_05465 [Candidatus Dependentiae bacterium]|nr:MAG: hypothetical protein US03_C0005G0022 [candidate division TM6 bacterium GW2011_GWF2_36_131]KKQ03139.1 MAG: hypothetical protein US13_C0005G0023 [candidate division TM6 bacterium GW2011_GWE2_36_25]KKQ19373.1 MAG: hypothetical protein US32_C0010G0022 [candidate division TM6 bacterium GW2011_GWA2_36_9]HBR71040.1 hypothetical protein [Candidatus Dependentiae bacterium]HCU01114.1 hypothetical protein [Candidatus Dependentiae bacterium]